MKVLLFSNDLMPFGALPTSGGGLRCWQLKQGLESRGIEVVSSMPGFTYLAEKYRTEIPEQEREFLWEFGKQDEILRRVKPDAVLFASNWDHYNLASPPQVPLIVDLHGSRLVETRMWGRPASPERKIQILSYADCLLTAGERQRLYFYGFLVQAGRVPEDEHFIRFIPVSLSPERFERNSAPLREPWFVSGGGWFPWQNQSGAIFGICNEVATRARGRIDIFGTPHEKLGDSPEEARILNVFSGVQQLAEDNDRIAVRGYIGRKELLEIYARAHVAVEAMEYNLERELAFTTRTVEYLWCGLPVIYNNFSEIASYIKRYDAGWTIDPTNPEALTQVLHEIYEQPDVLKQKSGNAQRLVAEELNWEKTISPLVDFLEHPRKVPVTEPALGAVYSRPSYLLPRGDLREVEAGGEYRTSFVVPAENIAGVELPIRTIKATGSVLLQLRNKQGRLIKRKRFEASQLPRSGMIRLLFPTFIRPKGGAQLTLEAEFEGSGVYTQLIPQAQYPYFRTEAEAGIMAVHFTPAEWIWSYQLRVFAARGYELLKKGQVKRVFNGIRYRMPMLIRRVREKTLAT